MIALQNLLRSLSKAISGTVVAGLKHCEAGTMKLQRALLLVSFLIGFSVAASAQQQAASLTGSVVDSSGAAVPGATVSISDSARAIRLTTTSNERGEYTFPQL